MDGDGDVRLGESGFPCRDFPAHGLGSGSTPRLRRYLLNTEGKDLLLQLAAEGLTRRVRHFTRGVIIGSRSMIDDWFSNNRQVVQGRSRMERQREAKSLGLPALRGLYAFRDVR